VPGELHIWRCRLDQAPCHPQWLAAAERQRQDTFQDRLAGQRHCAGRTVLRHLLSAYLSIPPGDVLLVRGAHGKPRLAGDQGPLAFNLSHSGEAAMYAVARDQEVGIDIERSRQIPNALRIAHRVMSAAEIAQLESAGNDTATFLRLWTCLEARQKCLGEGVFGRRVDGTQVGSLSFPAGEGLQACVAWAEPGVTPDMRFLELGSL
jgi:4'-phosphopantetheinyl transferase